MPKQQGRRGPVQLCNSGPCLRRLALEQVAVQQEAGGCPGKLLGMLLSTCGTAREGLGGHSFARQPCPIFCCCRSTTTDHSLLLLDSAPGRSNPIAETWRPGRRRGTCWRLAARGGGPCLVAERSWQAAGRAPRGVRSAVRHTAPAGLALREHMAARISPTGDCTPGGLRIRSLSRASRDHNAQRPCGQAQIDGKCILLCMPRQRCTVGCLPVKFGCSAPGSLPPSQLQPYLHHIKSKAASNAAGAGHRIHCRAQQPPSARTQPPAARAWHRNPGGCEQHSLSGRHRHLLPLAAAATAATCLPAPPLRPLPRNSPCWLGGAGANHAALPRESTVQQRHAGQHAAKGARLSV